MIKSEVQTRSLLRSEVLDIFCFETFPKESMTIGVAPMWGSPLTVYSEWSRSVG